MKPSIEDTGGTLRLKAEIPERVKGGTKLRLDWIAQDPAARVTVTLVVDGNPGFLFRDQPAVGGGDILVPKVDVKKCHIVLATGQRTWSSKSFEIVSHAPSIDAVDIEIPKK